MSFTAAERGFVRLGGVAALGGGALFVFGDVQHFWVYPKGSLFSETSQRPGWIWHQVTHMAAMASILVALPGIQLAQTGRVGRFAFGAYVAMLVSFAWLGAFVVGLTMATHAPGVDLTAFDRGPPPGVFVQLIGLCFPAAFLSSLLYAVASWRARVLPRAALVLLALSAPLEIVGGSGLLPLAGGLAMGGAFLWIGIRVLGLARVNGMPASSPIRFEPGTVLR